MPTPLRDVPPQAIDLIKAFEGIPDGDPSTVNIDAYLCPANVWTIGWGHAIVDDGVQLKGAAGKARARALYPGGITRDQAEALLRGDLVPRAAQLSRLLKVDVGDAAFGALLSLLFNIGAANLAASTLLRKLNAGDAAGAADQFLAWDKARVNGVLQPLAGLTRRRRAERAMFLGEDWQAEAAVPARRSRGAAPPPAVLPVPVMPDADRAALKKVARKGAARKAAAKTAPAKKTPAKKAVAKKAVAKKAAAKTPATPRARTTAPTAPRRPRSAAR
jgi:lysozyme